MIQAGPAVGDFPGEPGKPGEFRGRCAGYTASAGCLETADAEHDSLWIGKRVLMASVPGSPVGCFGDHCMAVPA